MQTLHVGPYSEEPATVAAMGAFAAKHGCVTCGKHHESYPGDPRRATPEKLKTVLRYQVEKA